MSTDIVEQLRAEYQRTILEYEPPDKLLLEAADEIERLRVAHATVGHELENADAETGRLRAVLQEIADLRYDNTSAAIIAQRALELS